MSKFRTLSARRIIAVIFTVALVCSALTCFPSSVSAETITIKNVEPAILVNSGDTVTLSGYSVEFSDKTVSSNVKWTYNGSEVKELKAEEAKVYPLVAESGSLKQNVYIIAKKSSDSEYVLYYNDFSSDKALDGWNKIVKDDGVYTVSDGKLEINALNTNNPRIYLPSWLSDFGNYRIDAVATQKEPKDASRWFSFIYRAQDPTGTGTPYYHMTIRNNMKSAATTTTGGIECCSFTDTWKYYKSASYTETVDPSKYYTFSVLTKDKTVEYQIDGNAVIHLDDLPAISDTIKGGVGIQANSSRLFVDSIKVTVQKDAPVYKEPEVQQILQYVENPKSNILNTPSNIAIVDSSDTLKGIQEGKPSNAVMYTDKSLNVNTKDGTKITTVEEAMSSLGKNIIPAFYIKDNDSADKITEFLKNKKIEDALIISADPKVAKYALDLYPSIRNAVDFTGSTDNLSNETLFNIRAATTGANSLIAIIPMKFAQSDSVYYLQRLGVAVWVMNDSVSNNTDIATMITSGATGLISNDYKKVAEAFTNLFIPNTLTKTPLIVGHRGNPSQAPENSISSYLKAVENGADCVETDVYLTKDNQIIILHDGTLGRTTDSDSTASVTQMTLEEIKNCHLWGDSDKFKSQFPDERVPTLEEMFNSLKDKNCNIFLEIKDGNANLIQPLADLVKKYNFESRVFMISFNQTQLTRIHEALPSMGTGFLMSATSDASSVGKLHESLYTDFQKYHKSFSTFDPGYAGFSSDYFAAFRHRGIPVFPWTFNASGVDAFDTNFLWGADSITTNDAQFSKNLAKKLVSSSSTLNIAINETSELSVDRVSYIGQKKKITGGGDTSTQASDDKNTFVTFIEGSDVASYENGMVKALKEGTASFMIGYKAKTPKGTEYVIYTQPITVNVKPATTAKSDGFPTEIILYVAGGLVVVLGGVFLLTRTKKKNTAK